jgi:hypothetical protein
MSSKANSISSDSPFMIQTAEMPAPAWTSSSAGMSAYSYDASNSGNACYSKYSKNASYSRGVQKAGIPVSDRRDACIFSQHLSKSNTQAKDSRDTTNMRNASDSRNTSYSRTSKNVMISAAARTSTAAWSASNSREASKMGEKLVSNGIMRKISVQ